MQLNRIKIGIFSLRYGPIIFSLIGLLLVLVFHLNQTLFYQINAINQLGNDHFWAGLTILGDGLVLLPLTLVFLRYRPEIFPPMLLTSLLTPLVLHSLKRIFDVARPGGAISPVDFYYVEPLYRAYSFPSGHSTTIFSWVCVVVMTMNVKSVKRFWGSLLLILASCVALSRILVGAHWPLDILCGTALGWSMSLFSIWLSKRWDWIRSRTGCNISIGFFLLSAVISLLFSYTDYQIVNNWQTFLVIFSLICAFTPLFDRFFISGRYNDSVLQKTNPDVMERKPNMPARDFIRWTFELIRSSFILPLRRLF
jgi:membrane-associated phospholipid phosphatase